MTIRLATVEDAPAIAAVEVDSWRAAYAGMIEKSYLESLSSSRATDRWRGRLLDPAARQGVRVADRNALIVGYVSFGPAVDAFADDRVGEVYSLYVHPEHWRSGHGGALLAAATEELRRDGFRTVILWVLPANHAARAFYETHGWRDDGIELEGTIRDAQVVHRRYSLRLTGEAPRAAGQSVS